MAALVARSAKLSAPMSGGALGTVLAAVVSTVPVETASAPLLVSILGLAALDLDTAGNGDERT
jgi:hypothetical protein